MPPPPSNLPPAPHPLRYAQDAARSVPGNSRRSRPLTYALSIAGIAGSGALIGAILNMNSQRQSRQKQSPSKPPLSRQAQAETEGEAPQSQTRPQLAQGVDYSQAIQTLETKRGHLVAQKLQLERRINDLHETRRRRQQAEEEEQEKEATKVK